MKFVGDKPCFCGISDQLLVGAAIGQRKWSKTELYWCVVDYIPTVDNELQEAVYRDAFRAWQRVCGLIFEQTRDPENADFLILTRNIDGANGTLAEHQLPYGNDAPLRGWFDIGDNWQKIDLLAVATHEFGHGIGLPHIRRAGNLMNPYYNPAIREPQADDISEARDRYGEPIAPVPPKPTPEADYPLKVEVTMASGVVYPFLQPTEKWGVT